METRSVDNGKVNEVLISYSENSDKNGELMPFVACLTRKGVELQLKEVIEKTLVEKFIKVLPDKRENRYVLISGTSSFTDCIAFYNELTRLITTLWVKEHESLYLIINFKYYNTGTSKRVFNLLVDACKKLTTRCNIFWLVVDAEDLKDAYEVRSLVADFDEDVQINQFVVYNFDEK